MASVRLEMPRPHASQRNVIANANRFNVLVCGRRWGKTVLGIDRMVPVASGGQPVAWFAPSYKLLADAWRQLRGALGPLIVKCSDTEHRMELSTGGVVDGWSLDGPDPARGRKYALAVVDEAALVPHLEAAWNGAIRPTLADLKGGAWFMSTPKGRNYFWQLAQRSLSEPDWSSWSMPTSTNPHIDPAEIEAARSSTPERWFAQEYLAAFIDDAGGVFRRVTEAATAAEQAGPFSGHDYVIGVDWGKLDDFTVLTVLDLADKCEVFKDRFNQIDYRVQVGRLKALAARWRPRLIVAERNSMGEPLVEELQWSGLPVEGFTTTGASKAQAIEALALAFERGDLRILNDPVTISELQSYETERLPSGAMRYGAPGGLHDDCVMSLALAWSAACTPTPFVVSL